MTAPAPETAPVHQAPRGQRNVLGIIALITAILGFLFACMPGALILGWVLLPIAFILALVSLFQRGKKRGTGLAALIVSVVGTVVGVIVFFTVVANAFDDAFTDETTASTPDENTEQEQANNDDEAEPAAIEEAEDAEEGEDASADDDLGSRGNPYPLGSEISSSDWAVTINSVDLDANQAVAAANQFNDDPEEGNTYILVNLTAEYIGSDPAGDMPWASVKYVSEQGNTFDSSDSFAVAPDSFDSLGTMYEGASESGNIVLEVPAENVGAGVLSVSPDMFADTVFVAVN